MLRINGVQICYGVVPAIHEVTCEVRAGEVVSIVGANGAGKTTLLRAISGLLPVARGTIEFFGEAITNRPSHAIARLGIAHVPEGRMLFDALSVEENLLLGAYTQPQRNLPNKLTEIYTIFPWLKSRARQRTGTLSGGQQQIVAIARGLIATPKLLILDEPSLGLMPLAVSELFTTLQRIKAHGVTMLLVEQNVHDALMLADRAYVLQTGRVTMTGTGAALLQSDAIRQAYLGL